MGTKKYLTDKEKEMFSDAYRARFTGWWASQNLEREIKECSGVAKIGKYLFAVKKPEISRESIYIPNRKGNYYNRTVVNVNNCTDNMILFVGSNIMSSDINNSVNRINDAQQGLGKIILTDHINGKSGSNLVLRYDFTYVDNNGPLTIGKDNYLVEGEDLDRMEELLMESMERFEERLIRYFKNYNPKFSISTVV